METNDTYFLLSITKAVQHNGGRENRATASASDGLMSAGGFAAEGHTAQLVRHLTRAAWLEHNYPDHQADIHKLRNCSRQFRESGNARSSAKSFPCGIRGLCELCSDVKNRKQANKLAKRLIAIFQKEQCRDFYFGTFSYPSSDKMAQDVERIFEGWRKLIQRCRDAMRRGKNEESINIIGSLLGVHIKRSSSGGLQIHGHIVILTRKGISINLAKDEIKRYAHYERVDIKRIAEGHESNLPTEIEKVVSYLFRVDPLDNELAFEVRTSLRGKRLVQGYGIVRGCEPRSKHGKFKRRTRLAKWHLVPKARGVRSANRQTRGSHVA